MEKRAEVGKKFMEADREYKDYTGKCSGEIYLINAEESDFETFVYLALQNLGRAFDELNDKIDKLGESKDNESGRIS